MHLILSPEQFMQRLSALVPRPRLHLIRFGVRTTSLRAVSGPAAWRTRCAGAHLQLRPRCASVVLQEVPQGSAPAAWKAKPAECAANCTHRRQLRLGWAKLLKPVCHLDLSHCPNCSAELKIIAATLKQPVIGKMLTHRAL